LILNLLALQLFLDAFALAAVCVFFEFTKGFLSDRDQGEFDAFFRPFVEIEGPLGLGSGYEGLGGFARLSVFVGVA